MNLHCLTIVLACWTEKHRFYHNLTNHLLPMLEQIVAMQRDPEEEYLLSQMAYWHDAVYVVGAKDNEQRSVALMKGCIPHYDPRVEQAILATAPANGHMPIGDELVDTFLKLDLLPLRTADTTVLHRNEALLWAEYRQKYGEREYGEGRLQFLYTMLDHPLITDPTGVKWLIQHISHKYLDAEAKSDE